MPCATPRRRRLAGVLALLPPLLCAACEAADDRDPPNVILISIDTLRADALGSYGGAMETPTLDRLAREGTVFEQASAAAPATAPSHASLLTGRGVLSHGVVKNGTPLPDDLDTLAEVARARGYATAGFVSSFVLDPRFGWDQGFDHFDADFPEEGATLPKGAKPAMFWSEHDFDGFDRRAPNTTRVARTWLRSAREPFFLFVHYFDPHLPYAPPASVVAQLEDTDFSTSGRSFANLSPAELTRLVRLYHAEVLFVDQSLGDLLSALDERTSSAATLVVVTSDHGEGLGQHSWFGHAVHLYEELLHVPLIFWWHRGATPGRRIPGPVSLIDVAPTIAELASLPAPRGAEGRSLAATVEYGTTPPARPLFAYRREMRTLGPGQRGETHSVRSAGWKYIRTRDGSSELFHLTVDPGELRNLQDARGELGSELHSLLDRHVAGAPGAPHGVEPSAETTEGLRGLGYVE